MGTRRDVDDKFHDMGKVSDLVRETLHEVLGKHAHDLPSVLVLVLDQSDLHRAPPCVESLTKHYQRTIRRHQSILELWASVTAHESGYRSASHDAAGEHSPSFSGSKSGARLQKCTVTQATDISHDVFVARLICWVAWAF